MKKTFYFRHDYNARNDEKLMRIRTRFNNAEGYGLFWFVVERMHEAEDGYLDGSAIAELALSYAVPAKKVQAFIDECVAIGLFHRTETGKLYSPRVLAHIEFRRERSASGKLGAKKKWEGENSSAIAQPLQNTKGNRITVSTETDTGGEKPTPRIHGKQPDGDPITDERVESGFVVLETIVRPRRPYRRTPTRKQSMIARLKEYTLEELEEVWASMAKNRFLRGGNDSGKDYLTVDYAIRGTAVEKYFNSLRTS